MIDIVGVHDGSDLNLYDAQSPKGANVLSVQLGSLEYLPEFGVDLKFFIQEDFQIQNESFKSYLIQRLTESNVNVNAVIEVVESLIRRLTFVVGDTERETGGFIR